MRMISIESPLLWLVMYILLSGSASLLFHEAGSAILQELAVTVSCAILSLTLFRCLKRRGRLMAAGLCRPKGSARRLLFYLPLVWVAFSPLLYEPLLASFPDILVVVLRFLFAGFLEEMIFRALTMEALRGYTGKVHSMMLSALFFALCHLLASLGHMVPVVLTFQAIYTFAAGIVLCLVFTLSGSILPGLIFHVLHNVILALTGFGMGDDLQLLTTINQAVMCLYSVYLLFVYKSDMDAARVHGPGEESEVT